MIDAMREAITIKRENPLGWLNIRGRCGLWANNWDWDKLWNEEWVPFFEKVQNEIDKTPATKWARGKSLLFEKDGVMRKQDSIARSVKKELDLLLQFHHPNIIPVLSHGEEDGRVWFDMPMYQALNDFKVEDFTEDQKERILSGVKAALNYLHENGYAHRDVQPANVLLDDDFNPYLIDFAWAHPCDGPVCVDFEPWHCMERAVPLMQLGGEERGYHTVVTYVRGITLLEAKATGLPGIPYQAIDGVGERDCEVRWKAMSPDVAGKRVLDVGCNLGWFVRKSLEEGALEAVGIDADEPTIDAARKLGPGEFHVMDAAKVDGLLGEFDTVFLLSVLQHLEKPDEVFDTVTGIAKETYIEIPLRFITPHMADKIGQPIGESERGRPLFKVVT